MITTLLVFIGFIVWAYACETLGVLTEWHHVWIGVILWFFGWSWLGVIVVWDDAIQHAVQLRYSAFRSPLHLAYRYLIYNLWYKLKQKLGKKS